MDLCIICPYCVNKPELVTGDVIYPHRQDLYEKWFYLCHPCDAYVGCHPGTTKPLGRLANAALRKAKNKAHYAFDQIWKTGKLKRKEAYAWLSLHLGIDKKYCHIGMFDIDLCRRVEELCMNEVEDN